MTTSEATGGGQRWILQFCHGYDGPFLDCARQYAVLFAGTPYKVCTVYLTGAPSTEVEAGSASDEVIFLNYSSRQVRGLKLSAIRDLKRIAASRDFALCIAHRFKPIYVALLGSNLPVIGVHHAFGDYKRRSRQLFANFFRKRLALLGVSNAVRDDMRACLPAWPAERIEALYNRIDVEALQAEQVSREDAREHLGLPQDAWVVGNVGRLHPDKDQATLIRGFALALPHLPAGSLLAIMGSGRLEAALKALSIELGVREQVRFLGQVANGRRYFKAFDVFALTSDHEPFGMVLLEAMAAGVPVVASDCGGAPEVIGAAGRVFPLRDAQALAAALQHGVGSGLDERVWDSLRSRFSDDAAKRRFTELPLLASCLRGGK
ncbi:Glycosyltransferase involved in cell wall bisynthesis [Pseudomonas peli]|uniref:Glycosyltransferase involved in cell wall bisynthesis n=1 Tax=Pseudomonas peli TaxID=592361 RepID=A0AB37Z5G1_9PSED|nr:glycosyltransferase [Pseudomonas peli]NMZ68340.1 glycosyltransferase [Pseudomonas peli]SCW46228.1 Glycosyltransferase involved in cell wall bisynthesis [Pseudomonas peli]